MNTKDSDTKYYDDHHRNPYQEQRIRPIIFEWNHKSDTGPPQPLSSNESNQDMNRDNGKKSPADPSLPATLKPVSHPNINEVRTQPGSSSEASAGVRTNLFSFSLNKVNPDREAKTTEARSRACNEGEVEARSELSPTEAKHQPDNLKPCVFQQPWRPWHDRSTDEAGPPNLNISNPDVKVKSPSGATESDDAATRSQPSNLEDTDAATKSQESNAENTAPETKSKCSATKTQSQPSTTDTKTQSPSAEDNEVNSQHFLGSLMTSGQHFLEKLSLQWDPPLTKQE